MGTIVQPYDARDDQYFRDWKTWFDVEDRTPRKYWPGGTGINGQQTHTPFDFLITNRSVHFITPPVQAVLEIAQRETRITRVFHVPELVPLSPSLGGRRDTYRIHYEAPLDIADGNVSYTLTLKRGDEKLLGSRGTIEELTIELDTGS